MKTTTAATTFFNWFFGINCLSNEFSTEWLRNKGFNEKTFCFADMDLQTAHGLKIASAEDLFGFVTALCLIDEDETLTTNVTLSEHGCCEVRAQILFRGKEISFSLPIWEQNTNQFFKTEEV